MLPGADDHRHPVHAATFDNAMRRLPARLVATLDSTVHRQRLWGAVTRTHGEQASRCTQAAVAMLPYLRVQRSYIHGVVHYDCLDGGHEFFGLLQKTTTCVSLLQASNTRVSTVMDRTFELVSRLNSFGKCASGRRHDLSRECSELTAERLRRRRESVQVCVCVGRGVSTGPLPFACRAAG